MAGISLTTARSLLAPHEKQLRRVCSSSHSLATLLIQGPLWSQSFTGDKFPSSVASVGGQQWVREPGLGTQTIQEVLFLRS